jgi:hypothetical protein
VGNIGGLKPKGIDPVAYQLARDAALAAMKPKRCIAWFAPWPPRGSRDAICEFLRRSGVRVSLYSLAQAQLIVDEVGKFEA